MSTIDVNTVLTDSDIEDEITEKGLADLVTDSDDGLKARQLALDDVLYQLANRVPPVAEADLSNLAAELKIPCVYGACARLYRNNMTTGDPADFNHMQWKSYHREYEMRVQDLRPTVAGGLRAAPSAIQLFRK